MSITPATSSQRLFRVMEVYMEGNAVVEARGQHLDASHRQGSELARLAWCTNALTSKMKWRIQVLGSQLRSSCISVLIASSSGPTGRDRTKPHGPGKI